MNPFKLIKVEDVPQASRVFREHPPGEAVFMAGGTDLLVLRRHGLIRPQVVIYLKGISGLSGCRPAGDGNLVIGALTPLETVARDAYVRQAYPLLADAAGAVGSPQIRHKGTIGGNICLNSRCWFFNRSAFWRAEYPHCRKASGGDVCYVMPESRKGCFALQSGDTVAPLTALGASLRLVSDQGERVVEIEKFYGTDGRQHVALAPGEILSEIILPPPRAKGVFVKFRPRNNMDFATFTLAVLPPQTGAGSRIVAACVSTRPLRALKAEAMLDQKGWDVGAVAHQAAVELPMVSFVRGAVDFKRQVIEERLTKILERFKR